MLQITRVADVLRESAAVLTKQWDAGERSAAINLHDLTEVLLTVAEELDPDI